MKTWKQFIGLIGPIDLFTFNAVSTPPAPIMLSGYKRLIFIFFTLTTQATIGTTVYTKLQILYYRKRTKSFGTELTR